MRRAARSRLHVAKKHESLKRTQYGDVGTNMLVPFAVETFGALGPAARGLLNECARLRQRRLAAEEMAEASWSSRSFMSYWSQRIAVALQVDIGRGIYNRAAADFAP